MHTPIHANTHTTQTHLTMERGVKTLNKVLNLVSVVLFLRQSHDTVPLPQPLECWENRVLSRLAGIKSLDDINTDCYTMDGRNRGTVRPGSDPPRAVTSYWKPKGVYPTLSSSKEKQLLRSLGNQDKHTPHQILPVGSPESQFHYCPVPEAKGSLWSRAPQPLPWALDTAKHPADHPAPPSIAQPPGPVGMHVVIPTAAPCY